MKWLVQTLRGSAGLGVVLVATLIGFIPLLPLALVKLLAPWQAVKRPATSALLWVSNSWIRVISGALLGFSGVRIYYDQQMPDRPDGRLILISNHQSWADVLLLIHIINKPFPFPRFFIKEQLRWLPIVGLACWALDFPFMKRYSRDKLRRNPALRNKDIDTVNRCCAVFREWPVTIINYAEGTRSNAAKRADADSPYLTMLPPKTGGITLARQGMGELLDGLLDMTVAYVNTPAPQFWDLICGRIPEVTIRVQPLQLPAELHPGTYGSNNGYRRHFKRCLEDIWDDKDAEVAAIQDPAQPQKTDFTPPFFVDERQADRL